MFWIYSFLGFSFFFFSFGLKKVWIFGGSYFVPFPSSDSFSVRFFNQIREDLLPAGVLLVTTNPMSAFVAQIWSSMLLGFFITTPIFFHKLIMYLRPALLPHEKKAVAWSVLPIVVLFISGSLFSYFFLIPATFKVLYPYAAHIGAVQFFSIDEFSYYVFGLTISVGAMFLLPIFMVLLSFLGIIPADLWKRHWRSACLLFLILSAIITPDGTGVTMVLLFLPLMGLYFLGYSFASKPKEKPSRST